MKRLLLPIAALVASAATPAASLEAQQRIVPFLGGGLASGVADLSNDTQEGWIVYGGVDFPLGGVTPGLSLGVTGSYTHIPYEGGFDEATNVGGIFGEVGYLVGATSSSPVKPYVRGGIGLLVLRYDPGLINTAKTSETRVGGSVGAGLSVTAGAAGVFLGAHFVSDGNAGFVAYHAGVAWTGEQPAARLRR